MWGCRTNPGADSLIMCGAMTDVLWAWWRQNGHLLNPKKGSSKPNFMPIASKKCTVNARSSFTATVPNLALGRPKYPRPSAKFLHPKSEVLEPVSSKRRKKGAQLLQRTFPEIKAFGQTGGLSRGRGPIRGRSQAFGGAQFLQALSPLGPGARKTRLDWPPLIWCWRQFGGTGFFFGTDPLLG